MPRACINYEIAHSAAQRNTLTGAAKRSFDASSERSERG
jgi:hypothetical protein